MYRRKIRGYVRIGRLRILHSSLFTFHSTFGGKVTGMIGSFINFLRARGINVNINF